MPIRVNDLRVVPDQRPGLGRLKTINSELNGALDEQLSKYGQNLSIF